MHDEYGAHASKKDSGPHGVTSVRYPKGDFQEGTFIPKKPNARKNALIGAGVFIGLLAIVGILAFVFIINKQVDVLVDGVEHSVRVDTTVGEFLQDEGLGGQDGDLVSITGNVITPGQGESFRTLINGVADPSWQSRILQGGEAISFEDGQDIVEGKKVVETQIPNSAQRDGTWGAFTFVESFGLNGIQMVDRGEVSGEEIPLGVAEEAVPTIITTHTPMPKGNKKIVALTFDDGPSPYTPQVLDLLAQHEAKATFFTLGHQVDARPEMVQRIVAEGHQVGNHSYAHTNFNEVDDETMLDDLRRGYEALENAAGVKTRVFRAPYGVFKESEWLRTNGEVGIVVGWTIDTNDWRRQGPDSILREVTSQVKPGSIVLLHDGGGNREQTVEALEQILIQLKARGYSFVTIDELIEADGKVPLERTQALDQPEPLVDIQRPGSEDGSDAVPATDVPTD